MIQFRFDHQYVSSIDALLKKQVSTRKSLSAEKPSEKQPIRLLASDELPFSLEKRHPVKTDDPVESGS